MLFSTVFRLCHGPQCNYSCFPGVLLTSTPHNIILQTMGCFPTQPSIIETTNNSERGMNPVVTTIINPRKDYTG